MHPLPHRFMRLSICCLLVMFILACQTTAHQTIHQTMSPPEMVFPLAELNKNPDALDTLFQNIMAGQTVIIKIDKDYIFPLVFDLKSKAAEVNLNNNTIELSFHQDLYLSLSKKAAKLSRDGRNWHAIEDLQALKKLLAYNKGTLTLSITANEGHPVTVVMTIATNDS